MQTNNPRGHHYNPEMLLKRFCDTKGQIWVNNGDKVYRTNPKNIFKQRDLNATRNVIPSASGQSYTVELTFEHEDTLSKIEDKAEPAIQRIIEQARRHRCPQLPPKKQDAWKDLYIAMARRTPEGQAEIWQEQRYREVFYEAAQRDADKKGIVLPHTEDLLRINGIADLVALTERNMKAKFSAGNHPILQEDAGQFVRAARLLVAVISFPTKNFVTGSRGLAIVEDDKWENWMRTGWLPVAPDVAIAPTNSTESECLVCFDNDRNGVRRINAINYALAARSWAIAGPSEVLVRSVKPTGESPSVID